MAAVDLPGFQHPFRYSHADFYARMGELDWALEHTVVTGVLEHRRE
jgi:hypothetical protein